MRILSCHIENFGKLHDCTLDFTDGLNTFCAENGWGKSTFAAFVRAMFYGLDGERKKSIEENERKRYKPWQGGVFGGQLVFETEEKTYQISRIFGEKDAADEFELRDAKTNLVSKDYSKKIGEELFKINRESFMRTIFLGQNDCETAATDDINAKIGNLTDNSNDLSSFDATYARLTDLLNRMTPRRATGSLNRRKEEIARLERLVQDGSEITNSMNSYQDMLCEEEKLYESLREDMNRTGELQTKVSKMQTIIARKAEWERLQKNVSEKQALVSESKAGFRGEVPDTEVLRGVMEDCSHMDRAVERMYTYELTEAEKEELDALNIVFAGGVPADDELEEKITEAGKLRKLSQQFGEEKMSAEEEERLQELEPYYAEEDGNVHTYMGKWSTRMAKKAALPSSRMALTTLQATEENSQKAKPKWWFLLLVLGTILLICGVVMLLNGKPTEPVEPQMQVQMEEQTTPTQTVAWILCGVGGLFFILSLLWKVFGQKAVKWEPSPQLQSMKKALEEEEAYIEEVDDEVAEYLESHGREFEEYSVQAQLQEIAAETLEFASLSKRAKREAESTLGEEITVLRERLHSYLHKFHVIANEFSFADELYTLKSKSERFSFLNEKRENFRKAEEIFLPLRMGIRNFLEKHGFVMEQEIRVQLQTISERADSYWEAFRNWTEAKKHLQEFETRTDVTKFTQLQSEQDLPSLEEINERILLITEDMEKVHSTILGYNKTLDDLQEQYEEWDENRLKLEELKQLQAAETQKYNYVLQARLKLELAKETMTAKYAEPIMSRFCKYFSLITKDVADKFHMDANTNVTVDELGKQRDVETLSAGYRDMISICLRVALVDVMYPEETPTIIMDDPFVNLDDSKLEAGQAFLEEIAGKYQVIYFTCSNARNYCR